MNKVRTSPTGRRLGSAIAGFTLIELMVAMTLMIILTGSIVFVFIQSQKIYTVNVETVQIFQELRSALDVMEQDIANAQRSSDMEFFNDTSSGEKHNGHYDKGEELGNRPPELKELFGSGDAYTYATTVVQRDYYGEDDKQRKYPRRADRIYFRTRGTANGKTQDILVLYDLIYKHPGTKQPLRFPFIQRVVYWRDANGWGQSERETLCNFVTDLQVEFYFTNRRSSQPGRFYSVGEAVGDKLFPTFKDPEQNLKIDFWNVFLKQWSGELAVPGLMKQDLNTGRVYFTIDMTNLSGRVREELNDRGSFMPMLQSGYSMFIHTDQKIGNLPAFEQGDYTASEILWQKGWPEPRIYFQEDLGAKYRTTDPRGVEVEYRAGWIPPAFRITLTVLDKKKENRRTVTRVFRVLGG